ncbi:MAG TPA: hypothetical protein VNG71_19355 [Pyrinomonadaceae bacterium]|nr:hypothetical protein [Pyrinomonadaceae bacterium]
MAALRSESDGIDKQRDVIKLDPNFHDAELIIGMYDYIVSTLPLPIRMLASIGGVHGSKKRGIQTLERVAKEGQWARDDARVLLIAIYKKEKRFPEALALSRELHEKYPRNYLCSLETADSLASQAATERQASKAREAAAMESEGVSTFETMLHERSAPDAVPRALDLIHVRYGEALLLMGQAERAAREFLAATSEDLRSSSLTLKIPGANGASLFGMSLIKLLRLNLDCLEASSSHDFLTRITASTRQVYLRFVK